MRPVSQQQHDAQACQDMQMQVCVSADQEVYEACVTAMS